MKDLRQRESFFSFRTSADVVAHLYTDGLSQIEKWIRRDWLPLPRNDHRRTASSAAGALAAPTAPGRAAIEMVRFESTATITVPLRIAVAIGSHGGSRNAVPVALRRKWLAARAALRTRGVAFG
jgi:hypothetical protein